MTKPYPYQEEGINLISKANGRVLLADEMGLGKTLQALTWIKRNRHIATPAIVVCPASLKWNWTNEAKEHIGATVNVLNGRTVSDLPRRKLTIVNYDILQSQLPYLKSLNAKTVVFDEVHHIKTPNIQRSKAAVSLCLDIEFLLGLTGTPLLSKPIELWHFLHMLDKHEWGGRHAFGKRYCGAKRTHWGWTYNGARNLKELNHRLIDTGMIRRLKIDVLHDLPAKTRSVIPVDVDRRKEYDEAENQFILWLRKKSKAKAKKAESAEKLVKQGYLKRLAAELKMKQAKAWIHDFLDNNEGKLIVFAIHKPIIEELEAEFKGHVTITGKTKAKDREAAVAKFQSDKKTRLFFGNLKAAGSGLTLTAASTVLFLELGWTPGEHLQAEDRPHRIGQKENVQCVYLVAKGTIEEKLCGILQKRQAVLMETIDGGNDTLDTLNIHDQLDRELLKG